MARGFRWAVLALCLTVLGLAGTASATGVKVGYLSCHEQGGMGFIFGATHLVRCTFSPMSGKPSYYTGNISRYGINLGYLPAGVVLWAVLAPTSNVHHGDLAGSYVGVSAEVAAGLGVGANVLVGGFQKSIDLEPISIEGATGLNLAAGVADLKLQPLAAKPSPSQ